MNKSTQIKVAPRRSRRIARRPPLKTKTVGLQLTRQPRTLNSIQTSLAKIASPGVLPKLSPYLMCRLNPFSTRGSGGIPDGSTAQRIVADHTAYGTFVIGADGGATIRMLPVPNMPTLIRPNSAYTDFKVNGITSGTGGTPPSLTGELGWLPFIQIPAWNTFNSADNKSAPPPEVANPYQATKFRIVSAALRLYYTGNASTASGTVTVQPNNFTWQYGGTANVNSISYTAYSIGAATFSVGTQAQGTVYVGRLDTYPLGGEMSRDSQTYRVEQPIFVRLPQLTYDHEFFPMYATRVSPIETTHQTCPVVAFPDGTWTSVPGFVGMATDWSLTDITISGATPGSAFRAEIAYCIEYVPALGSAFTPLAKQAPKQSPSLKNEDGKIGQLPTSQTDTRQSHQQSQDSVAPPSRRRR